jgi:hypothetical protein
VRRLSYRKIGLHRNAVTKAQPKPERITQVQDGYPQSWSFGMFGKAEYERTWWSRPGEAVPKLERDS